MTIDEAINYITHHAFISDDVKDMAIEALEKQIPKKATEVEISKNGEDIETFGEDALFGYCPCCGEFQSDLWNEKYCGVCGQAIDWKVEE